MIKAIETRYAGCRFRSRLEARYAVFFDHLGIAWEYEHEGFDLPHGYYLPDFWFPDLKIYGEVKGEITEHDLTKILRSAVGLSDGEGGDLIVFGRLPRPSRLPDGYMVQSDRVPTRLHLHKGYLHALPWDLAGSGQCPLMTTNSPVIAHDGGAWDDLCIADQDPSLTAPRMIQWFLRGSWGSMLQKDHDTWWPRIHAAYDAARSARFEHGESPGSARS
jgi:hypothetical protein